MVYVFDPGIDGWLITDAAPDAPMPGTKRGLMRVGDFCTAAASSIVWSDARALQALELLLLYAAPAPLRYAFRRMEENAHSGQSAHYAGLAFHLGQRLGEKAQARLVRLALDICGFERVEPPFLTPGWVHVEKHIAPPAGLHGGYPQLVQGQKGVHVMLLQDALRLEGYLTHGLNGMFTSATRRDLACYQQARGLHVTGKADSATWQALFAPGARLHTRQEG